MQSRMTLLYPAEPKTRVKGVKVKFVRSIGYESQYGVGYFHIFTAGDATLKWSTGTAMDNVMPGAEHTVTFTVKEHTIFNGKPQTAITRVKFESQEKTV